MPPIAGRTSAHAHAGNHAAFMLEQAFGDGPTFVQLANKVFFRYFHIGQECLAERRGA